MSDLECITKKKLKSYAVKDYCVKLKSYCYITIVSYLEELVQISEYDQKTK